ncbi:MAG: complex I subunit 4 family protein [Chloroflexota bacterium]|nr:MAG: hypothetical protein DLM70_05040 [Chloroflexota bacterium]
MLSSSNTLGFPLVSLVLFVPGGAAALALLVDSFIGESEDRTRFIALLAVAADFLLSVLLLVKFVITHDAPGAGWHLQFADRHDWVGSLGISYWVGVDGISVFLVALTALIMGVAIAAANFMIVDRRRTFLTFMLMLQTAVLGVFVAANLFLFFVFWEAMLIPMYFLMGIWGEERRVYATMKFLVYTVFGSFFMLVAIFYLWAQAHTLDMPGPTGLVATLSAHPLSSSEQLWLFLAFGIAFAVKLPIFPFHSWAPTAYAESPVPVVIALAGILSKAGAFGLLRYCLPLFPSATRDLAGFVSILAIIGMLYAAGLALVQTDIKRLVAYASISHVNLIALGIFALNPTALNGSVLQIVNHAVIITGLFLAVAYISARTGTRQLADMGGLGVRRPVLMWLFFVFVLAGLDLPGLSSFAGEFLILAGTFRANAWFATVAALTIILAAWYMIRFFQNSMNGPVTASPQQTAEYIEDPQKSVYQYPVVRHLIGGDLLPRELALFVPLIILIVYIGIQPDALTARINPTANPVTYLVHHPGPTTALLGGGR